MKALPPKRPPYVPSPPLPYHAGISLTAPAILKLMVTWPKAFSLGEITGTLGTEKRRTKAALQCLLSSGLVCTESHPRPSGEREAGTTGHYVKYRPSQALWALLERDVQ